MQSFLGVLLLLGMIGFGWSHTIRRGLRLSTARVKIRAVNNAAGTGQTILKCDRILFRAHKKCSIYSGPAMGHNTMRPCLVLPMMYASRDLHRSRLVFQGVPLDMHSNRICIHLIDGMPILLGQCAKYAVCLALSLLVRQIGPKVGSAICYWWSIAH